jgi:hypothetical protein
VKKRVLSFNHPRRSSAWFGHASLNTTNVYAEVDLEMKAKALAICEVRGAVPPKHWKDDVAPMQFLRTL